MSESTINHRYKIIVLGDSNTGKTSLIHKYKDDTFKISMMNTIGIDTISKNIVLNNKNVVLHIWDTAGQERFFSVTRTYYRNAHGIILVFDFDNERSFHSIDRWYKRIQQETRDIPLFLVGNKMDLLDESRYREMEESIKNKAASMKARYYMTSAKTGENVNNIFEDMALDLMSAKPGEENEQESVNYDFDKSLSNHRRPRKCC